ncbi:MAG: hypothetical protein WC071_12080, partial [Victivallaceae bacterium]
MDIVKSVLLAIAGLCLANTVSAQSGNILEPAGKPRSKNINPSTPYIPTQVQAQLRMNLDSATEQVHFIRDNNDPYVVTKTYLLKYADPYEIRPFILDAVKSRRVADNNTSVECIKYNDGAGILIVSAEEYRFKDYKNGMSIDQIVNRLDKPSITSSSGQTTFVYFPKYWGSRDLAQLVKNVGANIMGDNVELEWGQDHIDYDSELNCLFMFIPRYSQKNIESMLKQYDTPTWEVEMKYSVYEIYAENDAKIGADFQAWKNNAGANIFSAGTRYRDNWSAMWDGGVSKNGTSRTSYVNFNPKWNSRYLDFLASKGKAKVVTTGKLDIMNQAEGKIESRTNMFNFEGGEKIADKMLINGAMVASGDFVVSSTAPAVDGQYRILAVDSKGTSIDVGADFAGKITVARIVNEQITSYYMSIADGGGNFVKNGRNIGRTAQCFAFTLEQTVTPTGGTPEWVAQTEWSSAIDLKIYKDVQVETRAAADSYGFSISLMPVICENSTIVNINMINDSLTGWNSDGTPRITRNSEVNTKVMLSNKGNTFVIGGLEKQTIVSSVGGVPLLKDLPFFGWIFST